MRILNKERFISSYLLVAFGLPVKLWIIVLKVQTFNFYCKVNSSESLRVFPNQNLLPKILEAENEAIRA